MEGSGKMIENQKGGYSKWKGWHSTNWSISTEIKHKVKCNVEFKELPKFLAVI